MPKNVGYELADGSWSSDYKSGDKFVVSSDKCNDCFYVGEMLSLHWDDGTQCPKFINDEGHVDYEDWYCVKAYNTQKVPDFIERDTIVNLEVTGEELALLRLIVGKTNGNQIASLYYKLIKFKQLSDLDLFSRVNLPIIDLNSKENDIEECLRKVFYKPETENEKAIREAKEVVDNAKKALEDAESKLKRLL